jgi:hypothetical protein
MGPSDAVRKAEEQKRKITLPYNPSMTSRGGDAAPPGQSSGMSSFSRVTPPPDTGSLKTPPGMDMLAQTTLGMARGGLAEGGMLQEGGSVDPVSGNEVPVGSLQEEVRDDIPAQLSEGEFVFPADVVRYIGLEKLMKIRQAAKEGLGKMEAMGQMGNSEEATMDDTGEFESEIDEIMKEVEQEGGEEEEGEEEEYSPMQERGI